jgi:ubiquinone/menaquinone biosynthesis C-methylase UbiE
MRRSTSEKYDSAAKHYDRMETIIETLLFSRLRRLAVYHVRGETLEVGVGTGKNILYYPSDQKVTAIDFSRGMLRKAAQTRDRLGTDNIRLLQMDVERLEFSDNTFDTSISTFVFCTVPNPLRGLSELRRILKPGGKAIFLEHMKSSNPLINLFLYMMNLFSYRFLGTSMIRETQKNITASGFKIVEVRHLFLDVVRLIVAEKRL